MQILHTESSNGWGGQEIRIFHELIGMEKRGHTLILAVAKGGQLAQRARDRGFTVYEIEFSKWGAMGNVLELVRIIKKHQIDLINTHSSLDAWIGGIAARASGKKVVRTRHLSTAIRRGINSRLLYNTLADFVVTTSSQIISSITEQSKLPNTHCLLVATGVRKEELVPTEEEIDSFRRSLHLQAGDCLVGTVCVVRSWKGVEDFIQGAHLLRDIKELKWVIIGGGYLEERKALVKTLMLEDRVSFTGHLENPAPAIAALDIFALLSRANEGISQACLQAAFLKKPLITTPVGGLPEICRDQETGKLVPPCSPKEFASAVLSLFDDPQTRAEMGLKGRLLVENKFTMEHTLNQMEDVYKQLI